MAVDRERFDDLERDGHARIRDDRQQPVERGLAAMRRRGAQQRAAQLVAEQHAVPRFLQRRERGVEPRLAERERRELAHGVVGVREVRRDETDRLLGLDGKQAREALAEHLRLRVSGERFRAQQQLRLARVAARYRAHGADARPRRRSRSRAP